MSLDHEFFQKKDLYQLMKYLKQYWHSDCDIIPFTEKYYRICKQIFVKRFCAKKGGNFANDAFKIIEVIKQPRSRDLEIDELFVFKSKLVIEIIN